MAKIIRRGIRLSDAFEGRTIAEVAAERQDARKKKKKKPPADTRRRGRTGDLDTPPTIAKKSLLGR